MQIVIYKIIVYAKSVKQVIILMTKTTVFKRISPVAQHTQMILIFQNARFVLLTEVILMSIWIIFVVNLILIMHFPRLLIADFIRVRDARYV